MKQQDQRTEFPEAFRVQRTALSDSLYGHLQHSDAEHLSQALNVYIAGLEDMRLPEPVAASYLQVETLLAVSMLMQDSGCGEDAVLRDVECPRFDAAEDGFPRCCAWSYKLLKDALEYRSRYNGRTGNPGIARARYFLDRNYAEPDLMLKDTAAEARMSVSRFSTLFAREMGCTFTEYITRLRIEAACALLRDTQNRISLIAADVGYNDSHYFSWVFRRNMGMTPTEYREREQWKHVRDGEGAEQAGRDGQSESRSDGHD